MHELEWVKCEDNNEAISDLYARQAVLRKYISQLLTSSESYHQQFFKTHLHSTTSLLSTRIHQNFVFRVYLRTTRIHPHIGPLHHSLDCRLRWYGYRFTRPETSDRRLNQRPRLRHTPSTPRRLPRLPIRQRSRQHRERPRCR